MKNIKISFNPKQKHLDEIANWIIKESKKPIKENGNWISIMRAFENKNLVIATYKNETLGFYTLSISESTIAVNVAEVRQDYRKKGIGKLILDEIIEKYKEEDFYALHLFCAPESSKKIWQKLGFKYFPNNSSNDKVERIKMYKIIKPTLNWRRKNTNELNEVIEIWNDEPYKINDENPTWIWNIKYNKKTNILKKPIVHFGNYKWKIRWRKGNEVYKDCEYQNFNRKNKEFNCIVIKELPK